MPRSLLLAYSDPGGRNVQVVSLLNADGTELAVSSSGRVVPQPWPLMQTPTPASSSPQPQPLPSAALIHSVLAAASCVTETARKLFVWLLTQKKFQ